MLYLHCGLREIMADNGWLAPVELVVQSAAAGFALRVVVIAASEPLLAREETLLNAVEWIMDHATMNTLALLLLCLTLAVIFYSLSGGLVISSVVLYQMGEDGLVGLAAKSMAGGVLTFTTTAVSVIIGATFSSLWCFLLFPPLLMFFTCVPGSKQMSELTAYIFAEFTTLMVCILFLPQDLNAIPLLIFLGMLLALKVGQKDGFGIFLTITGTTLGVILNSYFIDPKITFAKVQLMVGVMQQFWVLSAGLIGAAVGFMTAVHLGKGCARRFSLGAGIASVMTLQIILPKSVLGIKGTFSGLMGISASSGFSFGIAAVTIKDQIFSLRLVFLGGMTGTIGSILHNLPLSTYSLCKQAMMLAIMVLLAALWMRHYYTKSLNEVHTHIGQQNPVLIKCRFMRKKALEVAHFGTLSFGMAALGTVALLAYDTGETGNAVVSLAAFVSLLVPGWENLTNII